MPLQTWTKGQYPEGLQPIPQDQCEEIEGIRDLLSAINFDQLRADPASALPTGAVLTELHERLDIVQMSLSRANSFVAQQDCEVIRQAIEDNADDMYKYPAICAGGAEAYLTRIETSITEIIGDLQLVLDDNGAP